MKPAVRAVALVAMAGALCTSHAVFAQDTAKSPAPKDSNAMRVVVDPETGEVRVPTSDELAQQLQSEAAPSTARASARAAAPASDAVLPAEKSVQRHDNGMLSVRMSQESLSLLKATTDASGTTQVEHDHESHSAPVVATEK